MKKSFNIISIVILVLCLLLQFGCGKKISKQDTVIFTDALGRQVKIPKPVKRIVSMAPNVTEMLFFLGLDNEIVGVTDFCNYPDLAKSKTKIGGYYNPNIEVILSLSPDLIVATPDGYSKERIARLEQSEIAIFLVNPLKIDDVLDSILLLGKVTGKEEKANQEVGNMRLRITKIKNDVKRIPENKRLKVFYEIGKDPLITVGPDNFVNDLIETAGGINIANDAPNSWPMYSVESVIMKNPDIILTAPPTMVSSEKAQETKWDKYKTISAVKNEMIYPVDPDILLRSGPRVVEGLELLYALFYER
ncbi:TPA: cobalamin-binding protein [bacterium]|nr:cobalamin-binding protein [bacterium]